MKQKTTRLCLPIITTILLILGIAGYYSVTKPDTETKNVHLYFRNTSTSFLKKPASVVVTIDGQISFSSGNISKTEDQFINLQEGKHTITVCNKDNTISTSDKFIIQKNKETFIYIYYRHFPEYETYLPFYKKNYLAHLIQQHKDIDTLTTKKKIDSIIDVNYLKNRVGYIPEVPNFKIIVQDYQNVIL